MKNDFSDNNSGYSLVELLIVMAIIAVLAAAALLSYTMIHSARAKDAAIKVGSEVNALKSKCMNMTPGDGVHSYYALMLYTDTDGQDTPHICLVQYNDGTNSFDEVPDEDYNLSSSVKIEFTGSCRGVGSSEIWNMSNYVPGHKNGTTEATTPVYICFDKRGNCYSGYGEYDFSKSNGTTVAHVNIGMNGSVSVR